MIAFSAVRRVLDGGCWLRVRCWPYLRRPSMPSLVALRPWPSETERVEFRAQSSVRRRSAHRHFARWSRVADVGSIGECDGIATARVDPFSVIRRMTLTVRFARDCGRSAAARQLAYMDPSSVASIPFFGDKVRLLTYIRPPTATSIGRCSAMMGYSRASSPSLSRASRTSPVSGFAGAGSTCSPSFGLLSNRGGCAPVDDR